MSRDKNRINGDLFEKTVTIYHNLYCCKKETKFYHTGDSNQQISEYVSDNINDTFNDLYDQAKEVSECIFNQTSTISDDTIKSCARMACEKLESKSV